MNEVAGKSRLRISVVMVGITLVALIVSYTCVTIAASWRAQKEIPRLAADSLIKALRSYYQQTGSFPANFHELESRVWKHNKSSDFGVDGRSLSVANYYYTYHPVDAKTCTIWIIPTGPRREEGATHFLLLTPDGLRRWKGAPLSLDEVKTLPSVPQYREMTVLGMTEQEPIDLSKKK
ncbi:MAG: hypothetical protein WBV94_28310 [Blastocatellia bacterium]